MEINVQNGIVAINDTLLRSLDHSNIGCDLITEAAKKIVMPEQGFIYREMIDMGCTIGKETCVHSRANDIHQSLLFAHYSGHRAFVRVLMGHGQPSSILSIVAIRDKDRDDLFNVRSVTIGAIEPLTLPGRYYRDARGEPELRKTVDLCLNNACLWNGKRMGKVYYYPLSLAFHVVGFSGIDAFMKNYSHLRAVG